MLFEAGAFYLMDRGYMDFSRLILIAKAGAFFVTRAMSNLQFTWHYSKPVDRFTGLRSDHVGKPTLTKSRNMFPVLLRKVRYYDSETSRELVFLTNILETPALTVAMLYKARWSIELFFRWIKGHLRIKHYYGTSPNAVKTQIWRGHGYGSKQIERMPETDRSDRTALYSLVMITLNILIRKGRNSLRLPRPLTILSPGILVCLAGIASWTISASAEPPAGVISPNGSLAVTVDARGPLTYQVQLDGKPLLTSSRLGLAFGDGLHLGEHVEVLGIEQRTSDTGWRNDFGKCSKVRDHFNETRIHLKEIRPAPAAPVLFDVVVRAYDDGVALRYDLPKQSGLEAFTLTTDQTTFTFPKDARALGGRWSNCAEVQYPETRLAALPDSRMCLPVVAQTDHATVAIAEADVRDWAGMFLKSHQPQNAPLLSSAKLTGQSPPLVIDVDVSKLPNLVLETTEADDGFSFDHTVWADASLVRADGSEVSLSSLTPVAATQGFGTLQQNLTVEGKPITLRGKAYAQGLGTHSASRIEYALKTEGSPFVRFKAVVGIDDETAGKGSAVFRVANTVLASGPVTLGAELASNVVSATPRQSPWRVLLVGRKPGALIESNIMVNLATPSQVTDTTWIKPGIMAWDKWWSVDGYGNMASDKEYIDLASDMGWPYMLVDWGWCDPVMPGVVPHDPNAELKVNDTLDLPALLAYAKQKNVKLVLWLHSNNLNRIGIDKTFATVEKWGAAGVKIDFMDRSDQDIVKWYEEVLASAAKHHLLVNFHGAYVPTGLARTWPNYITQEGILGNEFSKFGVKPNQRCDPKHHITLPFTRGLLGPGDFTPGGFLNRSVSEWRAGSPTQVMGTRARQLALATLLDSPLLCMADSPANYRGQTGLEYFRGLPTVWDETRVLSANLAEHLVEARRKGDIWYIAAMNHDKPLTLRVPLDFLGSGTHTIRIFADKPESATTPTEITDTARPVTAKDLLEIPMVANGGFAARIRRGRHSPPAAIGGLGHHSVSRPLRGMAMKIDAKVQ